MKLLEKIKKSVHINGIDIECKGKNEIPTGIARKIFFNDSCYSYVPLPVKTYEYLIPYFFSLRLKNIIQFFYENDFISLNGILKNIQDESLIFCSNYEIQYYKDFHRKLNIILKYNILSEEWNKKYTIKIFKEHLKEKIKKENLNTELFVRSGQIYFIFSLTCLESKLNLKEINEEIIKLISQVMDELEDNFSQVKEYKYEIDKRIRTGVKQYFTYFNEYVERTKGITIKFEVENYEAGLILKIDKNQNIEKIEEYFEEYMNFLKYEKIEDIQPIYEIERTEHDKKEDIIFLHGEIQNLRHKYEQSQLLLNEKERYALKCQEETNNYRCFIEQLMRQNTEICNILQLPNNSFNPNIALTFNNNNTNTNTNTINISQQIETLQEDIERIKDFFKELEIKEKEEELDEIDDEILEVSNAEDLKSKKKMFNKFKRIVNQINDENSTLNETIKAAKKGKECLEKIKPYIPTILTTISNLGEYFK